MSAFKPRILVSVTSIFAHLLVSPTFAQSSNPAWIDDLAYELAVKHECKVVEYLDIQEGQLGGRNSYFAKVKCVDGREFDASKIDPKDEFDIRLCEIVSC